MRLVSPTMERRCSRHLVSAVGIPELARALEEALRTGRHAPAEVKRLAAALQESPLTAEGCDDFFVEQIGRVVEIFVEAAARDHAIECEDDEPR